MKCSQNREAGITANDMKQKLRLYTVLLSDVSIEPEPGVYTTAHRHTFYDNSHADIIQVQKEKFLRNKKISIVQNRIPTKLTRDLEITPNWIMV